MIRQLSGAAGLKLLAAVRRAANACDQRRQRRESPYAP